METKIKQDYVTPTSESLAVKVGCVLCQSNLGMKGGEGDSKLEDRDSGGYWGGADDWN